MVAPRESRARATTDTRAAPSPTRETPARARRPDRGRKAWRRSTTNAVPVTQWLRQLDRPPPRKLPLIALVKRRPEAGWERIYCDPAKLGGLAVEMLVGLMHRGEIGVPRDPHQVLLRGEWCPAQ